MDHIRDWLSVATDRSVVSRAVVTALIVGAILGLINHGAELAAGRLTSSALVQIVLTFAVPYLVSTGASVAAIRRHRDGSLHERRLLEREIQEIVRFPDQNPNPVLRLDREGRLAYANPASAEITASLGIEVNEALSPELLATLRTASASRAPTAVELAVGARTFAILPVDVRDLGVMNLYGTDITAAKALDKFPESNPHPVLRISESGVLRYANAASEPILAGLAVAPGEALPTDVLAAIHEVLEHGSHETIDVQSAGRTYSLTPVSVPEFGFVHLYGTDVTAERAITKFPGQNPHPVLRVSRQGRLLYANPAGEPVRTAFETAVGDELPAELSDRLRTITDSGETGTLEVEHAGRIYELLVVPVYEFGFINLYGTDVTAARLLEQAHRESERLLLNILPEPIADRLKKGETVIADRFDEMTVLFADVVGFTQLSTRLTPAEIIDLLNSVFSDFDELAERYGLEKIKTIGDAYMVVGGLDNASVDHAALVADMALEMLRACEAYRGTSGDPLRIRIGMHTGPAVAGVIGIKKFIYDVWGDTVNTASRMESHSEPGRIQVTEATYERLRESFSFEPRGTIEVKGKGPMPTWFLLGRASEPAIAESAASS